MKEPAKKVVLKPGEEFRILDGDFWIYDNEIASGLSGIGKGEVVRVYSDGGGFIATAYANSRSTITLRVLSRDPEEKIDRNFLKNRIERADRIRKTLRPNNTAYRMVFAEADFLPGLVIDRFDDYFIVQITTAGMERFKEDIFSIVIEMYPSAVVVEKSISTSRLKEDLPEINRVRNPGRNSETVVSINGLKFRIDFLKSQKTGFFLDQRDNYLLLENISRGKDVLDAFSYAGAWGLHAYKFGARRVDFLEISAEYLDTTRENVRLNGFNPRHFDYIRDDALKRLKEMSKAGEKRDVIILDPPAFAKSRHKLRAAIRGYKEINLRALNMLIPGGFLITCSCSYFLTQPDFIQMVLDASADARRRIKLIDFRSQPYDHSILLPLYQSAYLKCGLFYVY
jgi:23S rRNA (cytosine1962-C5)-methyltransferase